MGKLRGLENIWKNNVSIKAFLRAADANGYDEISIVAFLRETLNISGKEAQVITDEHLNCFPYYNGRE